jgi:hypothetical protein
LNMRSTYGWREGEIVDRLTGKRVWINPFAKRFGPRRQKKRTTRTDRKWNRANRPALTPGEKIAAGLRLRVQNRGVRPYQLGLPAGSRFEVLDVFLDLLGIDIIEVVGDEVGDVVAAVDQFDLPPLPG